MRHHVSWWAWVVTLLALASVAWVTLVPTVISTTTFAYASATAFMLLAVILSIVKHSGPPKSIGDVLSDLEDRRKTAR